MRLLARDGLIFLLFCGCRPKAGLQGARRLRLLLLLPGLLSSKMNADSLSDWAYFCRLSCSFSFYDVCLLRSGDGNSFMLYFPANRNSRSPGGPRIQRVANGFGKLVGRDDDGAAASSPAADSLVVTRQPSAPSCEG